LGWCRIRKYLLTAVAVLVVAWVVSLSGAFSTKVTATWSYDYNHDPACAPTQLTNCVDHFEVLDISDQNHPKTILSVPNPSLASGLVKTISVSFPYGPPFGRRSICVIAVGRDAHGSRTTSNPFSSWVTVTIYPGSKAHVSTQSQTSSSLIGASH
jgi:hypothetical protein